MSQKVIVGYGRFAGALALARRTSRHPSRNECTSRGHVIRIAASAFASRVPESRLERCSGASGNACRQHAHAVGYGTPTLRATQAETNGRPAPCPHIRNKALTPKHAAKRWRVERWMDFPTSARRTDRGRWKRDPRNAPLRCGAAERTRVATAARAEREKAQADIVDCARFGMGAGRCRRALEKRHVSPTKIHISQNGLLRVCGHRLDEISPLRRAGPSACL